MAIGWVCHHGLTIPIPGSVDEGRIGENCKPVELNDADMEELQSIMKRLPVAGARYAAGHEKLLNARRRIIKYTRGYCEHLELKFAHLSLFQRKKKIAIPLFHYNMMILKKEAT